MKKVIVISIVIVAAIAIFAAVALKSDISVPEAAEKAAVEQQQLEPKDLKIPPKTIKTPKIMTLDKEKLKEVMKKMKEKEKDPNYHKKGESCGE